MAEGSTSTARRRRQAPRRKAAPERAPRRAPSVATGAPPAVFSDRGSGRAARLLTLSWWLGAVALAAVAGSGVLPLGGAVALAVLAGLLVAVALANAHLASPRRMLARVGGRRADEVADARLVNLVDGLCFAFGLSLPELVVLDDPAPNTLALGPARSASLVVTTGALSLLGRIELEALLAHELAHIRRGDSARATAVLRAVGLYATTGGGERVARRLAGPTREALADRAAIAATRYPPGLADALAALAAAPTVVPMSIPPLARRLTSWQWCAPLVADDGAAPRPGELSLSERAQAMREL